jgi:hypothetical protein
MTAVTRKPGSPRNASSNSLPSHMAGGLPFSELSSNHENGEAFCRVGGYLSERGQVITHPGSLRRAALSRH